MQILSNGGNRNGTTMDATGLFLDYQTIYNTKATYLYLKNLGATYALLINFNTTTGAADVTALINKTVVVEPGGSIVIDQNEISNATIFCSGAETTLANYVLGKREFMRGGA